MKWLLAFVGVLIILIVLFKLWIARLRRISRETGVYPAGREELNVIVGERRYWVWSDICVGGPIERRVDTKSVRDITGSKSFKDGIEVDPRIAEEVLRRVRLYYQRRRTKAEYLSN